MQVTLKETERIDDLQLKGLKLIQDKTGFCFGIDAVLLANFAKVKNNAKVVDLGTGTGIIPILIAGKSKASKIIGVEIQEEVYEMATRSVKLNDLEDRVDENGKYIVYKKGDNNPFTGISIPTKNPNMKVFYESGVVVKKE